MLIDFLFVYLFACLFELLDHHLDLPVLCFSPLYELPALCVCQLYL